MANRYTDDDVREGLAEYELTGHNMKLAARNRNVPEPTLRGWVLRAGLKPEQNTRAQGGHDYQGMWGSVQVLAVSKATKVIPDIVHTPDGLRALTTLAGVAADKHLNYRDGRPGTTLNVDASTTNNTLVIEYKDDWRA